MSTATAKIVFLDRDGTINVDYGYVTSPDKLTLIPGAANAIAALNQNGFSLVIVTNQSAIARGMATEEDVLKTNAALLEMLREENPEALISQVIYCPDHPDTPSDRRKPGIGMLRDLQEELLNFDRQNSWMIGDKLSDIEFGKNAKLPKKHCVLVKTGSGEKEIGKLSDKEIEEITVVNCLTEATSVITTRQS